MKLKKELLEQIERIVTPEATYSTKHTWNTTNTNSTICKMLYHLEKGNLYSEARKYFETHFKNSLDAEMYMGRFMEALEKINSILPIDKNSAQIKQLVLEAVGKNNRTFNLRNYEILRKEGLCSNVILSQFDDNFRGDITKVHSVYGKYIVIETVRDSENNFYVLREGFVESEMFHEFEEALFFSMAPRYHRAMNCLFKEDSGGKK